MIFWARAHSVLFRRPTVFIRYKFPTYHVSVTHPQPIYTISLTIIRMKNCDGRMASQSFISRNGNRSCNNHRNVPFVHLSLGCYLL
jgi:hypothetical protein